MGSSPYNRKSQLRDDIVAAARRWYRTYTSTGSGENALPPELGGLYRRVRTLEGFSMTHVSSGCAL